MIELDWEDPTMLRFIGHQESQFLVNMPEVEDETVAYFRDGESNYGDTLPWSKTHNIFRFRPSEVSLWAGINGHGKSALQNFCMGYLVPDTRVMIASMEMKIRATAARMIKQAAGGPQPTEEFIRGWFARSGNLWMYDKLDNVPTAKMLAAVHHSADVLGCKHIVIDSLMKCGIAASGDKSMNQQHEFVNSLCKAAKEHDVHIHLVHHMRKGEHEEKVPDKFDVKGNGGIVDQVDNLIIVHRNKRKERMVEQGKEVSEAEPDATMRIAKQRHHAWEGDIKLWYHKPSGQYTPDPRNRPMPWPNPNEEMRYGNRG